MTDGRLFAAVSEPGGSAVAASDDGGHSWPLLPTAGLRTYALLTLAGRLYATDIFPADSLARGDIDAENLRFIDIHWADIMKRQFDVIGEALDPWSNSLIERLARRNAPGWILQFLRSMRRGLIVMFAFALIIGLWNLAVFLWVKIKWHSVANTLTVPFLDYLRDDPTG